MSNRFECDIKPVLAKFDIDAPSILLQDIVLDSRDVSVHHGFAAVKGHALDGRSFIPQAISLGARLILSQCDYAGDHGNMEMRDQTVIISFFQLAEKLSALAAEFYSQPAEKLDVIAVTGTNGKTSVVQLLSQMRSLLGDKAASIGTLGSGFYDDSTGLKETVNTTPDACQIQKLLREFVDAGANQAALEASSHALVQNRIQDMKADIAVFTNLTRDHLDYHGSMQEYASAKRLLINLPELSSLVINADDPESANWIAAAKADQNIVLFSKSLTAQDSADFSQGQRFCLATDIIFDQSGCKFKLISSWGEANIHSKLLGQFNISNLLAALASQLILGRKIEELAGITDSLNPVAGRMELFSSDEQANIIVDYAHTPDALMQALIAARLHCKGKLICIFGCGGDRDKGKRTVMGTIAEQHSDAIIITSDNSRSEKPDAIVEDILRGIREPNKVQIQLDRKLAIRSALKNCQLNDLILVAGKGHETTQTTGDIVLAYNERDYVHSLYRGNH